MATENDVKETMDVMEKSRIQRIVESQRARFSTGRTFSAGFRREKLKVLAEALSAYEGRLIQALQEDLGKSSFESYETELGMVKEELRFTQARFGSWMRRTRVKTPLAQFPSKSAVYREPLGVALILSPWNYPVNLALTPLISAIAAGNCAVVKPSRNAPATAAALAEMIGSYFDPSYIALVESGENTNRDLLEQRFDHIFFTGSPEVGKTVMEAAARNLTPVTLELGGKSPCIVDRSAKIDLAARRIVWGKCVNAGQTCVAPDYVLVDEAVKEPLISAIQRYLIAFFGSEPLTNKDLPRIVNERHFQRLVDLMEGQQIRFGGQSDANTRKIAPAVLVDVDPDSPVMQEEIFGPILPILSYQRFEDAVGFIKEREKPLALYLFTSDRARERRVIRTLSFGGGCVNDTLVHLSNPHMPFGGVGGSGMGAYHGKRGFDTFTHEKSVLRKSSLIDIPLRYPPYEGKEGWLRLFLR